MDDVLACLVLLVMMVALIRSTAPPRSGGHQPRGRDDDKSINPPPHETFAKHPEGDDE